MAIKDKIISFWKQVKLKSSDMFTLFRVGIGVKVPTNKLHVKDSKDPLKIEGLQNDTTDPDKFITIDSNNIVKYRTGAQLASDIEVSIDDLHGAGVDGAANQLLTDDGDGTVTSESALSFTSNTLTVGTADAATSIVTRKTNPSGNGGKLHVSAGAGTGTNKSGGDVTLVAGTGTGSGVGGEFKFQSHIAGSSGTVAGTADDVAVLDNAGNLQVDGGLTVGSTSFVNSSGVVQVATQGTIDHDSLANFVAAEHIDWAGSSAGTVHSSNIPTLNQDTTGTAATVTAGTQAAITTCANLTTVGTIGTGTWNADVIASAKLDADTSHLSVAQTMTGRKLINTRQFDVTSSTDGAYNGDVIFVGTGSTVLGKIHTLRSDGAWIETDADSSYTTGFLAVALGTDPDVDGMLIRGMVTLSIEIAGTEAVGNILYVDGATAGAATVTAPSGTGDYVRVIGYVMDTDDQIYFNPDNAWVEIA